MSEAAWGWVCSGCLPRPALSLLALILTSSRQPAWSHRLEGQGARKCLHPGGGEERTPGHASPAADYLTNSLLNGTRPPYTQAPEPHAREPWVPWVGPASASPEAGTRHLQPLGPCSLRGCCTRPSPSSAWWGGRWRIPESLPIVFRPGSPDGAWLCPGRGPTRSPLPKRKLPLSLTYDKVQAKEEEEREEGQRSESREREWGGEGGQREPPPRLSGLTYWEEIPHQPQEGGLAGACRAEPQ